MSRSPVSGLPQSPRQRGFTPVPSLAMGVDPACAVGVVLAERYPVRSARAKGHSAPFLLSRRCCFHRIGAGNRSGRVLAVTGSSTGRGGRAPSCGQHPCLVLSGCARGAIGHDAVDGMQDLRAAWRP